MIHLQKDVPAKKTTDISSKKSTPTSGFLAADKNDRVPFNYTPEYKSPTKSTSGN